MWVRLDDGFWMHPKVVMAGNEVAGVFVRMLSYCGQYTTDGAVATSVAMAIAGDDAPSILDRLEECGLIVRQGPTQTIVIPDWLEYNPSGAEVKAEQAARKERAQKAADTRWQKGHGGRRNAA